MPSTTPTSTGEASSCYFPNVRPQSVESNSDVGIEPSYYSVVIQLDLALEIELFCDNGAISAEVFRTPFCADVDASGVNSPTR